MGLPMPFPASRITGRYGDPRPNGRIHLGLDFWADRGTPILASGNGTVLRHHYSDLGGHILEVRYDNGEDWNYYHSDARFPIADGARVSEGTPLGFVGSLGAASTGPHVHVEIYANGSPNALNPESRMDMSRSVAASAGGGGSVVVGGSVLQTQLNLRLLGYYLGELDNDPGPKTKQAIYNFQAAEGLDKDSIAGPITLGRLSDRVKEIQDKLNRLGYSLTVDGENGDNTAGAVRDFQSKNGLVVDGIAGPLTRAKISEKLQTPPTTPPVVTPPVTPPALTEADVTPKLITPSASDFPKWVQYEEKFDFQVMGSKTWNLDAYKYYGQLYIPVESHCHWWGLPKEAGTHDGNVEYLNKTDDVGANYVTSPKRITLTTPLNLIALTTGKYNPIAWKSENDPIMTTPEGREWGYKTLAVLHYLVERANPSLRKEALKLHKDYYSTRCSDIDVKYLRELIEQFFSGELDFATGLPPVVVEPGPDTITVPLDWYKNAVAEAESLSSEMRKALNESGAE